MKTKYEMIDRDMLSKAERLLTDAMMFARANDDKKLIDRLDKTLDALYVSRCRVWEITDTDE